MRIKPWQLWLAGSLIFVAILALAEYVVHLQWLHSKEAQRSKQLAELAVLRSSLEANINACLYLGNGLVSFIHARPTASPSELKALMADVYKHAHYLKHVAIAPDLVVRYIYPLTDENRSVMGFNYRQNAQQWPAVKAAIDSKKTVIDAPVRLIQGGSAIISRTPVWLDDKRLWGVVAMVLDLRAILDNAGFYRLQNEFTLRLINPQKADGLIAGPSDMSPPELQLPVRVLAENWRLEANPKQVLQPSLLSHLLAMFAAIAVTVLALLLLREHDKAQFLANHDTLTALPNRRYFMQQLAQAMAQWQQRRRPFTLFFLDVNDFKGINDRYGHQMGDAVLAETALRLRQCARGHDLVARIGGDEFVLLLTDLSGPKDIEEASRRFSEAVQAPMTLLGHTLTVQVALGRARPSSHGDSAEDLIRQADVAMYRHKTQATSAATDLQASSHTGP
ncbi:diguanylate cyclase domain-containing protein [Gallaecimonas mangrovi]|uniref:diguanylate cyclase domain-containing protein n=1 Tax=Gallaecimonas mangrovi TaxID=2291597 RepID=UPI000E202F28|nr:diguanylate cyclase [Gallaecimonas mangrovi]